MLLKHQPFVPQTQTDCLSSSKRPKTENMSPFCHVLLGSKEVPLVENVQSKKKKKSTGMKNQMLQDQKRDKSETNHHIAF